MSSWTGLHALQGQGLAAGSCAHFTGQGSTFWSDSVETVTMQGALSCVLSGSRLPGASLEALPLQMLVRCLSCPVLKGREDTGSDGLLSIKTTDIALKGLSQQLEF